MTENRMRPYKDIIFYHKLSKHNMDTRRKTNPLYTLHFTVCQGWCALYAGPPNEMTGVSVQWQNHMTARCHSQGVQMYHCSATHRQWHPLNPKRHHRGRASLGAPGVRTVVLTTIPCTSVVGEHSGLKTSDFRFLTWDNADRWRIAVNKKIFKRKPIFYIYVQGFKFT